MKRTRVSDANECSRGATEAALRQPPRYVTLPRPTYRNAVGAFSLGNNYNFDTNAPLFEVRGKVILEGVMHHIRPINLDLRL
jgi:hypothetical protein